MSGKFALIIGNTEYADAGLAQLAAPGKDAEDFGRVLKDPNICAFDDVKILLNQPEHIVRRAIEVYFDQRKPDDLIVFYFSGHGIRDELGALYLAVKNTVRSRLRSTAIKSDYVKEIMEQSRSKRQVLILDCCNSGAFAQGTKAAMGVSMGTATAFEAGYGRIILTASDSTQFAWEGNKVIGDTDNSLFTHFLVGGLEGAADLDGDGCITVDELYDYAYEQVKLATPKQTPSKFSSKQQGEIFLRQSIRMEDTKPVALHPDLLAAVENTIPFVREGAVKQLEKLLNGKNARVANSARALLEKMVAEDDSRNISLLAKKALESASEQQALRTQDTENKIEKTENRTLDESKAAGEKSLPIKQIQIHPVTPIAQVPIQKPQQRTNTKVLYMLVGAGLFLILCVGGGMVFRSSLPSFLPTNTPAIETVEATTITTPLIVASSTFAPVQSTTPESTPIVMQSNQSFSPLSFCLRSELDTNNQCTVSRMTFVSPVQEVCASWIAPQQYLGSAFRRVWRNNNTGESHTNENSNAYGCLSWSKGLSTGQYEVELYANGTFIQKGGFLITSTGNVPLVLRVSERQEYGKSGLLIYKDIYFVDPDGDAYVVAYELVSTSLRPSAITVKNDPIKSTSDEQKKGATVVGAWECDAKYGSYSVVLKAKILDSGGNQSEPFLLEFNCK